MRPSRRRSAEAGCTQREVAAFGDARGPPRREPVGLAGCLDVAGELEQVGADGLEPVGQAIRSSSSSVPSTARPVRGPWTIATATARFSVTTGPGETSSRTS